MQYYKKSILIGIAIIATLSFLVFSYFTKTLSADQTAQHKEVIKLPGSQLTDLPFSPAIKIGNMMFLSGTIGNDPETNELVSDDIGKQTRQTMENLKMILQQGGMSFSDVVRATVYLTDINDYAKMNKVYAEYFPKDPPARACVQVAKLVKGAKVEISMIAIRKK